MDEVKENDAIEPVKSDDRVFTPADIEKRRAQLLKAMNAFEKMLTQLAAQPAAISNRLLGTFIQAAAVKIFRSTARFGPMDPEAEQRFIMRLDLSLGFSDGETRNLIENCRRFAAAVGTYPH